MSAPKLTTDDWFSAGRPGAHVIAACERFEADWNAGRPRRIEDEIAAAREPIRRRLFRELLALELELTRRDGRLADLGAYLARFPDRADAVREVFACETVTVPYPEATEPDDERGRRPPRPRATSCFAQLGEGGQATTYLARDRALQRLVVLKRYHGVASVGPARGGAQRGPRLARIRSPFVAPCYGVETRGDEIDLVVEYVPGRPLTELTAEERADSRRCARLVEQVAEGLAEVHACGLVHRDIKPQNIILGDDGVPRLVDFGLAVPVASEALHAGQRLSPVHGPRAGPRPGRADRRPDRRLRAGGRAVLPADRTAAP